jgi:hypothetical protein
MNVGDLVKIEEEDIVGLVTVLEQGIYTISFAGEDYPDFYCTLEYVQADNGVTVLSAAPNHLS